MAYRGERQMVVARRRVGKKCSLPQREEAGPVCGLAQFASCCFRLIEILVGEKGVCNIRAKIPAHSHTKERPPCRTRFATLRLAAAMPLKPGNSSVCCSTG